MSLTRSIHLRGLVLTSAALAWAVFAPSSFAAAPRVVSADGDRVVFEVDLSDYRFVPSQRLEGTQSLTIPGFGSFAAPGEPRIPATTVLVALPPEADASVRYTIQRSQPLGRHLLEPVGIPVVRDDNGLLSAHETYRIDPAVYNREPAIAGVRPEAMTTIRRQRVLPITVAPVSYDPATGDLVLATSIRVEVTFRGGARGIDEAGRAAVPETGTWDRILSRVLINPEQARQWRARPLREPRRSSRAERVTAAGGMVKLEVRTTGMHRVRAASAIANGFPSGTATADLHVYKRAYDPALYGEAILDVPFKLVEDPTGVPGVFDASDWVVFYGQELRTDTLQGDPLQKFSDDNVYWLGDSSGPRMTQKSLPTAPVRSDTATVTFTQRRRFEEDHWFWEETPPGIKEFYYHNLPNISNYAAPFTLHSVAPSTTFLVRAQFLGGERGDATRQVRLRIANTSGTFDIDPLASVPGIAFRSYTSSPMPSSMLVNGLNTFQVRRITGSQIQVLLNFFDIEYQSLYRTSGNVLDFSTGSSFGPTPLTIVGLSRNDVLLFDVTDPFAARECTLSPAHFTPVSGGYALSFEVNPATEERYIVTPLDAIPEIPEADVDSAEPSYLIGHPLETGVDVLVVSHALFMDEIRRWVSYRQAQGYRVILADVEDVFDEFNGGVNHPRAMRRAVKHYMDLGGLGCVLLVGDASEDNKRVHIDSAPNFVPTESFSEYVGAGFNVDEVVTSDKWLVMLKHDFIDAPSLSWPDYLPDVIVGRLPAGEVEELQDMLDKIFLFEQPKGDDFWRRRMIKIADDAWSSNGFTYLDYHGAEEGFELAEINSAAAMQAAMPGGFDIVMFLLSNRIDHPPTNQRALWSAQHDQTRMVATPALFGELDKGATFVSLSAHMNRHQVCHEVLLTTAFQYTPTPDPEKLTNLGRPFILFGWGCHLSDYALHREKARTTFNPPNGDSFDEQLLFHKNAGAVATYASTGFEYLGPNKNYTEFMYQQIFNETPTDPIAPDFKQQARWILGELMTVAEIENLMQQRMGGAGQGGVGQAKRYHILGDPLLRIDGGPPRFDVTVDGRPFNSGDQLFSSGGSDSITVVGTVTDEVAIEKLALFVDGVDVTPQMTSTALVDTTFDAARQYRFRFGHVIRPGTYDIEVVAYQAADTLADTYHVAAKFVLKVQLSATLAVDGRPVYPGEFVPPKGNYVFTLTSPVAITSDIIGVEVDGTPKSGVTLEAADADSSTWLIRFPLQLGAGPHTITILVADADFQFPVVVGTQLGVRDVIAYPNPFVDDTHIVYQNDVEISDGSIDIFTVSGKKVAHLPIPPRSRLPGQNAVHWDGRTFNGDPVSNGVYLFVMNVNQSGTSSVHRGKMVRTR